MADSPVNTVPAKGGHVANEQNQPQPAVEYAPDLPATWELVIADMQNRDRIGRETYGTPLQPCNGRDSLVDAYQEALDFVVYLRNEIEERKRRTAPDLYDALEAILALEEEGFEPDEVLRDARAALNKANPHRKEPK